MASSRISGSRLEGLWQQSREPVFWLNSECKLALVNRAWEDLTGHSAGSVLGVACQAHGPTRAGDLAGLGGSFSPPPEAVAGRPSASTTWILHAGGERRWRRVEFWPFHDHQGVLLGLLGLIRAPDAPPLVPESEAHRLRTALLTVRDRLQDRHGFDTLIGFGPAHRRLLEQVRAAAGTDVPVLIVGEPGTGKHLTALTIHQQGPRRQSPLVPIDCAALPPDVLARELFEGGDGDGDGDFGHRLRLPDGATLLIGDVLDLPRDLQGRLAAATDRRVRLLAVTAGDPEEALKGDRLRPDLYYALTTLVIRLSPLRDRMEEFPVLAQHVLERANLRGKRQRSGFAPEALAVLSAYDWPGNLRELVRVIDAAHGQGESDPITADDLPAGIRGDQGAAYLPPPPPPPPPLDELLARVERRLIENALLRARQNKSKAADLLGVSRPRLYRRIKELGLPDEPEPIEEAPPNPDGDRSG